jgi:hypothetical protein
MNDAFDELERQLKHAVRTGAARGARRARRRMPLLAAAAAVLASGAAVAATHLGGGPTAEAAGRKIALQAVRDTRGSSACQQVRPVSRRAFSDAAPLSEITAALPALKTPAPAREQARALSMVPGAASDRPILRRTARTIAFRDDITVLVYVQQGAGVTSLRDPGACAAARRDRVARLGHGRSADVRGWALRQLAEMRDTTPRVQTLWVSAQLAGQSNRGGSGSPVVPGQRVASGLLFSGSAFRRAQIYVGLADPRATRIRVRAAHRVRTHVIEVIEGLFALVLPRHTGPVELVQLRRDGARLGTIRLRG